MAAFLHNQLFSLRAALAANEHSPEGEGDSTTSVDRKVSSLTSVQETGWTRHLPLLVSSGLNWFVLMSPMTRARSRKGPAKASRL